MPGDEGYAILAEMMIGRQLEADFGKVLSPACRQAGFSFERPKNSDHGDFASSIALKLFKEKKLWQTKKEFVKINTSIELAQKLIVAWRGRGLPDYVAKIEAIAPGFINVFLDQGFLLAKVEKILTEKENYGRNESWRGKKVLLEHTSPNPQTTIMLGHLRNNFLGMSVARLLEFGGAKVTKDCLVNDRGIHLCRSMWGYLVFANKKQGLTKTEAKNYRDLNSKRFKSLIAKVDWQELIGAWNRKNPACGGAGPTKGGAGSDWYQPKDLSLKSDHFNLIWYVLGSRAFKEKEEVQAQVKAMLVAWEKEDKQVRALWQRILAWSDQGYEQTYRRIGSVHDHVWYESKLYKKGKELIGASLKKRVFKKSKGAVVSNLKKKNLPDLVAIKSDGASTYLVFDLNLSLQKTKKFPADLYIWTIGAEQTLYFQQLFALCHQLGIGDQDQFYHLCYSLINFKGGKKMSTRSGNVVTADEILDLLEEKAAGILKTTDQKLRGKLSEKQKQEIIKKVALGAVKYGLLAFNRDRTILFDIKESLSLRGNSGPYLQYTYSRANSVLEKAFVSDEHLEGEILRHLPGEYTGLQLEKEERLLLRRLYRFKEVVWESTQEFAPSLLCNFLYELANDFNLFYDKLPILKAVDLRARSLRLRLTQSTAQVMKNGLTLLGVETIERM